MSSSHPAATSSSNRLDYHKSKDERAQACIDIIRKNWNVNPTEALTVAGNGEVAEPDVTVLEKLAKLSNLQGDFKSAKEALLKNNSARLASYKKTLKTNHISTKDIDDATRDIESRKDYEANVDVEEGDAGHNLRAHRKPSLKKAEADALLRKGRKTDRPQEGLHNDSGAPEPKRKRASSLSDNRDQTPTGPLAPRRLSINRESKAASPPQEVHSASPDDVDDLVQLRIDYVENNHQNLLSTPVLTNGLLVANTQVLNSDNVPRNNHARRYDAPMFETPSEWGPYVPPETFFAQAYFGGTSPSPVERDTVREVATELDDALQSAFAEYLPRLKASTGHLGAGGRASMDVMFEELRRKLAVREEIVDKLKQVEDTGNSESA